jgi:hypothetical protein
MTAIPIAAPVEDITLTSVLLAELAALRDRLNRITERLSTFEAISIDEPRPVPPRIAIRSQRMARGWSQTGLIARLRAAAAQQGYRIPSDPSMKTMLSKWENGHNYPGSFYADLLGQVFTTHPVPAVAE